MCRSAAFDEPQIDATNAQGDRNHPDGPFRKERQADIEQRHTGEHHAENLFYPDHPDTGSRELGEQAAECSKDEVRKPESEAEDEEAPKTEEDVAFGADKGEQGDHRRTYARCREHTDHKAG